MVVYRAVPGIPADRVRVGDDGSVQAWNPRLRKWIDLKRMPLAPHCPIPGVRIRVGGAQLRRSVARLVLLAFHGPAPPRHEPVHFPDPDHDNCRPSNLRWAPVGWHRAGVSRAAHNQGSANHRAKIGEADVSAIRAMSASGMTAVAIGARAGLHPSHVRKILVGRRWRHVPVVAGP
jgi:hypothetical protein